MLLFSFAISPGDVQEASRLLGCKDVRVNCLDEVGEHERSKFCSFDMQELVMMLIVLQDIVLFSNECCVHTFIEKRGEAFVRGHLLS